MCEAGKGAVGHGDGYGSVELDDGGGDELGELSVEHDDASPVGFGWRILLRQVEHAVVFRGSIDRLIETSPSGWSVIHSESALRKTTKIQLSLLSQNSAHQGAPSNAVTTA